ncbi:probable mediator of RNA polymerase II transcription subunit 26c isoform X1 [Eucalyptus grandis]|uniref:probable mediator of RNA polymerase II transcription subunit 26c isoform X1 n=1 Tax=Eucalyptus grandis TaxID=71139 RepID=UPI000525F614|nr:probable mediator of RNA polymerase II transcription subunit 26c isoform X1 [Eucalyptus grandis]
MDLDDFRTVLESSGVDVWTFIDTAITVASLDNFDELKRRRDGIVERLYAATLSAKCGSCQTDGLVDRPNGHIVRGPVQEEKAKGREGKANSPSTPQSTDMNDELDPFGGLFDDEQKRILEIKRHLEDPDQQSADSLVELLQSLADMDITFQALEETDIGRHVNQFRKHPSNDVRRLVKHLVRKWKAIVDEWVTVNQPGEVASSALLGADGDSPQQKVPQNGYSKVPEFGHSPNPQNGSSGSERNYSEPEAKAKMVVRKETPSKPHPRVSASASAQNRLREQKESGFDAARLASARKRLQANYKEAENAKKQRTIQVMDIHEIPKPKNAFFGKNKAGGSQGKHW